MKRTVLFVLAAALFVCLAACNYSKPAMYVTLTNNSGTTLRNVEVDYPGGVYGMNLLGNDQTNRRIVALTPPCKFTVKFDAEPGKTAEPHGFDLGDTCPKEVIFTVEKGFAVTRRIVQP
jgi:hypothetical protein